MAEKKFKLSAKQKLFCEEYLIDLNATQAAIRAGYSKKTANANAARMMVNDGICEYIVSMQAERSKRVELTADFVVKGLMEEAQYCSEGSSHGARVRALEVLGKHRDINLWKESIEHSVDEDMVSRILRARERIGSDTERA